MKCYGCERTIRRGFPMITQDGDEVIICEKCHRLWKKHQTEEKEKAEAEVDADLEYQMASDMRDYCERYEPTYDPENGSM